MGNSLEKNEGYGDTPEKALEALKQCIRYNFGINIQLEESTGRHYADWVVSRVIPARRYYVFYYQRTAAEGIYMCSLE